VPLFSNADLLQISLTCDTRLERMCFSSSSEAKMYIAKRSISLIRVPRFCSTSNRWDKFEEAEYDREGYALSSTRLLDRMEDE
jgi:hypothetical protein